MTVKKTGEKTGQKKRDVTNEKRPEETVKENGQKNESKLWQLVELVFRRTGEKNCKKNGRKNESKVWRLVELAFMKPAVITVLLTALLGPYVVQSIVNKIEEKKLQTQVMEKILQYTDSANFNEINGIIKLGVIAKIISENKHVFNLSLEKAEEKFDQLTESFMELGITNLAFEIKNKNGELKTLKDNTAKADKTIHTLNSDKARLEEIQDKLLAEKKGLEDRGKKTTASLRKKIEENLTAIKEQEKKIETSQEQKLEDNAKISELEKAIDLNREKVKNKDDELKKLARENRKNKEEKEKYHEIIERAKGDEEALKKALKDLSDKWAKAIEENKNLKIQLENVKTRLKEATNNKAIAAGTAGTNQTPPGTLHASNLRMQQVSTPIHRALRKE